MIKYVYEVPSIFEKGNMRISGYNFSVNLDSNLAILSRQKKLEKKTFNLFKEEGERIVKSFFKKPGRLHPYLFVGDSWLVHVIQVPGDACDLALDESGLNDFLEQVGKD